MKKDRFVHSLRIQLFPDSLIEERTEVLIDFCKKYGFNDVMLMINAEEFNFGHITIEEARPWVEKLKGVKKALIDAGICVSVNNWIEMGHLARGRKLKPGQNFTTMVDFNGLRDELVACPIDTEWQDYFCEYAGFLVRELEPDYFWIEDDFRYHNHAPLTFGGCFCEKHIALFNSILGTSYTREEFVERAFAKGKITPERKVWLDTERKSIVDLAERITKAIKAASPKTEVALMSSSPENHCIEARDWNGLLGALAQGGDKLNRIHLPSYLEMMGKTYIHNFNRVSMAIRHFSGDDTKVWPEVENGTPNMMRKSPRYLRFHMEGSLPLVLDGMTYSINGFCGNGAVEELGFGKEIKRLDPYFNAVRDQNIRFSSLSGVTVPAFEDVCYKLEIKNGFGDLTTSLFQAGAYIASLGLSFKYSSERNYRNETVALLSDSVHCFTDEEIIDLFENNAVILDGSVASVLYERGLGNLIGAEGVRELPLETPTYAYEMLAENRKILGINGYRSTIRGEMGRYFDASYGENSDVKVLTKVYSAEGNITANGFAEGKNFLVLPYMVDNKHDNQFCELRRVLIKDFVLKHTEKVAVSECTGIYPYLYADKDRTHVMVTNALLDDFDSIVLDMKGINVKKVSEIGHDGIIKEVPFTFESGKLTVKTKLPFMSCVTLIVD